MILIFSSVASYFTANSAALLRSIVCLFLAGSNSFVHQPPIVTRFTAFSVFFFSGASRNENVLRQPTTSLQVCCLQNDRHLTIEFTVEWCSAPHLAWFQGECMRTTVHTPNAAHATPHVAGVHACPMVTDYANQSVNIILRRPSAARPGRGVHLYDDSNYDTSISESSG